MDLEGGPALPLLQKNVYGRQGIPYSFYWIQMV